MSSISGISSSVDLYNILQSSTANAGTAGVGISASPQTPPGVDPTSDPDGDGDQQVRGHHHRHGQNGLQGQIQSAVTSALKNADSSQDPNQTVQEAIAAVLQGGADGVNPDGSGGQDGTAAATGGGTGGSQFAQLLQANGITPQDFQNDLKTAWTDNGSGGQSLNFSTLFQSFPPGSAVDTTA